MRVVGRGRAWLLTLCRAELLSRSRVRKTFDLYTILTTPSPKDIPIIMAHSAIIIGIIADAGHVVGYADNMLGVYLKQFHSTQVLCRIEALKHSDI